MELQTTRTSIDVVRQGSFAAAARLREVDPSSVSRATFGERVLAPLLPSFRQAYPELAIELLLDDHPVDLVEDQIDIAIRFGSRPHGDFAVTMLTPRAFRVCASPGFVETHGRPATPEQLSAMDCLLFSTPGYRNAWRFRDQRGRVTEIESGALIDLFPERQCAATSFDTAAWLIYPRPFGSCEVSANDNARPKHSHT